MPIQSKLPHIGTTIFTVMSKLATDESAINLSQGFPGFGADPILLELVGNYTREGYNQYAPMAGISELRTALAEKKPVLLRDIIPVLSMKLPSFQARQKQYFVRFQRWYEKMTK